MSTGLTSTSPTSVRQSSRTSPRRPPSQPRVWKIALRTTVDRLRTELPPAVQVGGAAAENHALEKALAAVTPLVLGIVLGLGFLLLVALQAPLAAALSVVTNLLAVGAAFGVGRLIFQDGHSAGSSASPARATWTRGRRCSSSR